MAGTRWQRLEKLFDEALARRPEERASFLAEACGEDGALRAEAERLLAHDQEAPPEFMRPPERGQGVGGLGAADGPDPRVGTSIGGYRIKSVIASGGMGTVYLAEQASPQRDVALKVMRTGLASRSALRRFEYESQILARLRHPSIAQVYEAGTSVETRAVLRPVDRADRPGDGPAHSGDAPAHLGDARAHSEHAPAHLGDGSVPGGVPYFVMKYIPDALTITQYAEENKLGNRARLELFAQVCDAVHHGHQKGIIHRDLKPANILVADEQSRDREGAVGAYERGPLADARGSDLAPHAQVKVIDFGVARSTDSDIAITTLHTDIGQIIGTLQYMSPEQCEADPDELDTRSDVYALGVVLYELLCGKLPYDVKRTAIHEAAQVIREEPATRPSTITGRGTGVPAVGRDLETIVLKALEKDRERRYQSAADLGQDVRRYLNAEPIEARPPTAWTRGVRWVTRHPIITTTAACMTVAFATLIATMVVKQYYVDYYLHTRPHAMSLSDDRREASLFSIGGDLLHTWHGEPRDGITAAELVDRPAQQGGGQLAVLGCSNFLGSPCPGAVCAIDLQGDLDEMVWTKRIETTDIPPKLREDREWESDDFGVHWCEVIDVFHESPGKEIVAVYSCTWSARAIRIYDLQGNVLYQVWHDGSLSPCYWMSNVGVLVFLGLNSEKSWEEWGGPKTQKPNPCVVFGIRPRLAEIRSAFLDLKSSDEVLRPEWYKYLDPPAGVDSLEAIRLSTPSGRCDPGWSVRYVLCFDEKGDISLGWNLDEFGEEIQDSRIETDNYQRHPELHTTEPFQLRPWPPIVSATRPPDESPPAAGS